MKPKSKISKETKVLLKEAETALTKKTRKPRAPKKGDIDHWVASLVYKGDDGHDNVPIVIHTPDVVSSGDRMLKINGALVTIGESGSLFQLDGVVAVYKVTKPQKGDELLYQGNRVEYLHPYESGKRYHVVKLPSGMTFKVSLSELCRA